MEQLAYSPRQACEALGIGRTTLYGLIGQGHLIALSLGGQRRAPPHTRGGLSRNQGLGLRR